MFPYSGGMVVDRNPEGGTGVRVGAVVGAHYSVVVVVGLGVLKELVGRLGLPVAGWAGRVVIEVHYSVVIVFGLGVFGEFVGWRGSLVVGWVVVGG